MLVGDLRPSLNSFPDWLQPSTHWYVWTDEGARPSERLTVSANSSAADLNLLPGGSVSAFFRRSEAEHTIFEFRLRLRRRCLGRERNDVLEAAQLRSLE